MNQREITYQTMGQKTYLVILPPEEGRVIPYLAKMVEYNQISGLLPMSGQIIDGRMKFSYEISGKTRLVDMASRKRMGAVQGEKVIGNLVHALLNLDRYFLSVMQCVLDIEYIFIDDALNVYLPYYPVEIEGYMDSNKVMSEFFVKLLGTCFMTEERNEYFDTLLRFLIMPGFTLPKFKEIAVKKKEEDSLQAGRGGYTKSGNPSITSDTTYANVMKSSEQERYNIKDTKADTESKRSERSFGFSKKEEKIVEKPSEIWQDDILIPGMSPADAGTEESKSASGKAKKKKEKEGKQKEKEKKKREGKGFFGFLSKKETSSINMEEDNLILSADARKSESQKEFNQFSSNHNQTMRNVSEDYGQTVTIAEKQNATVMMGNGSEKRENAYILYQGRKVEISASIFKIGKQSDCNLVIPVETVSRSHAEITCSQGVYYFKDMNSMNHSFVNNQILNPYEPRELQNGDEIRLAEVEMVFYTR